VKALDEDWITDCVRAATGMPVAHAVELISTSKREESLGSAISKAVSGHRGLSRIDIHEL